MYGLKDKVNRFSKTLKNLPGYTSAKMRGKPFHWTMSNNQAKGRMYNFQKAAEIRDYYKNQVALRPELSAHAELQNKNVQNLQEVNIEKLMEMVKQYPGNLPIPRQNFNENLLPYRPKKEEFVPIGIDLASAVPYTSGELKKNIRKNLRNRKPVSKSDLETLLEEGRQNDFMLVARYLKNISRKKGGKSRKTRKRRAH